MAGVRQDSLYLADHLPGASIVAFPGQGHFAHVLDPVGVATAIREFVAG